LKDDLISPDDEFNLDNQLSNIIETADKRICDQLSEVSSVDNLIELRDDFEKRLKNYFKE
jgi:hypothetical protein